MEPCAILYYPNGQDNKIETPTDLLKFGWKINNSQVLPAQDL
jgi:hypothetical protein